MTETNSISPFTLPGIPGPLRWSNHPSDWVAESDHSLAITTGPDTDWFFDPGGKPGRDDAPVALFTPPDPDFLLQAKVTVGFGSAFDAGALCLFESDDHWAKICYELSPRRQPMVVSVVTRGFSDDCDSVPVDGSEVYLRLAKAGPAVAFHFSRDGKFWRLVRYFRLRGTENPLAGFLAQSPTGPGCRVVFSEIGYRAGTLRERRSGE
jgi:uncharacterized protein